MNDLIPTGPNQRDIAEMARLRAIMNGTNVPAVQEPIQAHYSGGSTGTRRPMNEGYAPPPPPIYTPSGSPSRQDVDAMKNLLEKLNDLGGEETAPRKVLQEAAPETSQYALPAPSNSAGPYTVLVSIQESHGKEVNRYNVVDSSRQDVVPGLVMKEAATAIMKLMNKGNALHSAKVQEVVDLEETFNRNRIETTKHKARYTRSMELGENSAATVFKERFATSRANALAAQDQIKSILESIR